MSNAIAMSRRILACAMVTSVLAGCSDEMNVQRRYDAYGEAKLFKDGKVLQAPPPGTMARDDPAWTEPYRERPPLTTELLARGQERYGIFCSPCHDDAGYGHGVIPSRGFPQPPSYHSDRLRAVNSRYIFDVITNGYGVMYSYARRVPPKDRWAIAAYVRALQISQGAQVAELPGEDRHRLDATQGEGGER